MGFIYSCSVNVNENICFCEEKNPDSYIFEIRETIWWALNDIGWSGTTDLQSGWSSNQFKYPKVTWAFNIFKKICHENTGQKILLPNVEKVQPPQIQSYYPDAVYIMQQPTMSSLKRIENRNFAGS